MAIPKRVKCVRVYLHPDTRNPFVYKGVSYRAPRDEFDVKRELMAFWLEEDLYLQARRKYDDKVAAGDRYAFPQFVLLDASVREKKVEDIWDQRAERVPSGSNQTTGTAGRPDLIIRTFKDLDHSDDSLWNKDGSVSIREFEKIIGFDVTKAELEGLVGDITRQVDEEDDEDEG